MPEENKQSMFAVVELFGHARIAGAVSEQTLGGSTFVRVDVPEIRVKETDYEAPRVNDRYQTRERTIAAHSRSFGPGAIYSLNWCDQETAVLAARSIVHEPLKPYSVREALASLPVALGTPLLKHAVGVDDEEDRDEIPY